MIPKIIHYCWFGGNPLPKSALDCIESWKKFLPDYEIKEWNESNFDVNSIPYTKDAYEAKKYAFVSDYARFWILYHYGGLYFDTDVEAVANMDDLVNQGPYMAWETPSISGKYTINPGLGLAAPAEHSFYKQALEGFEKLNFYKENGERNDFTMIPMITGMLAEHGMKTDGSLQTIQGITMYPDEYFCPMDSLTGVTTLTKNTKTIHHFSMSWLSPSKRFRLQITRLIRRYIIKK